MDTLVEEIHHRLSSIGIKPQSGPNIRPLAVEQKALLLRVIIFGAFYPNYFSRQVFSGEEQEREAVRALNGLDPFSTVRLGSFPTDQPPKAYVRQIKDQVENQIFSIYILIHLQKKKTRFPSYMIVQSFRNEMNLIKSKNLIKFISFLYFWFHFILVT